MKFENIAKFYAFQSQCMSSEAPILKIENEIPKVKENSTVRIDEVFKIIEIRKPHVIFINPTSGKLLGQIRK